MPRTGATTSTRVFASLLLSSVALTRGAEITFNESDTCTSATSWRQETLSYDLSGCALFNATAVQVDVAALAAALGSTGSGLQALRLAHNGIDEHSVAVLAGALLDHASLTDLHLHMNDLSASGAAAIAGALRDNTMLTQLRLTQCNLRNEGAMAIAELLRENTVITDVNLEYNDIATPGMAAIGGALQENDVLRSLQVGVNPIFPAGAAQLANGLRKNKALEVLNVRYSGIQDGGMVVLANALRENRVLRELDVWYNAIGDAGVAAMGHTLKENGVLKRLNLWHNNISDVGVEALAAGLNAGTARLESLHLGRNAEVGDASAVALQRVLYTDESLTFIDFGVGHTQVGDTFEKPLNAACRCNGQLRKELRDLPAAGLNEADKNELEDDSKRYAADCRAKALAKVPMRMSIKELMKANGVDREAQRKAAEEQAEQLSKLVEEIEKLPPKQRDEVKRKIWERREEIKKQQMEKQAAAEPNKQELKVDVNGLNSPHYEHLKRVQAEKAQTEADEAEVNQAFGASKEAPAGEEGEPPKKRRATREQQEARRRKRAEQAAKEEL
jgi:Ran GTPase-activating protein (RanGAP) involved in mRNA processing and transport